MTLVRTQKSAAQKSATTTRKSAEVVRTKPVESLSNHGQIEQVVSSADCRSAEEVSSLTTHVSEQIREVADGREALPGSESAESVSLVMALGGTVHRSSCHTIQGRGLYKTVAPELDPLEVAAFLAARKFLYVCGTCLRDGGRHVLRTPKRQVRGPRPNYPKKPVYMVHADGHSEPAKCFYCPAPADVLDHVVPKSRGGTDEPGNLVGACNRCNSAKGSMSVETFITYYRPAIELPE